MRSQAFSKGFCRQALDKVYPDGIAPAKKIVVNDETNDKSNNNLQEVEQKAWVKLYFANKNKGVVFFRD